ncbi:MAG: hypothetical protein R2771_04205 [Saprospiraceae bacterium]
MYRRSSNYYRNSVLTEGTEVCTESPVTFTITVKPTPNGTIASNDPICEGDQAQLTFTGSCENC